MFKIKLNPAADKLTVLLAHDGNAKEVQYTCSLRNADGTAAMPDISGRKKVSGPHKLPGPPINNIGRTLDVTFTYIGPAGIGTRLTVEVVEIVHGVPKQIGGFDEEKTIPAKGMESYGETYEIC